MTKDDDDDEEKEDSDKDDDDDDLKESVSLEDIINEEVESISIDANTILESLEGETLTEEDKVLYTKMAKLIENRIKEGLRTVSEKMVDTLEDANETFQESLVEKMDKFTAKVVKEWKAENHVAIQTNAKTRMHEEFVEKILGVVTESSVTVSEEELEKIDSLNEAVAARDNTISNISDELLEAVTVQENLRKELVQREFVIEDNDQKEIFLKLVEDVEYTNEDDYRNRLNILHTKYITESKEDKPSEEDTDAEVKSLLEDMQMFEDIDIDMEELNEADAPVVQHPSGRVNTLLESLKGKPV